MYYNKDDIDSLLICPRCAEKFNTPILIVPCCETLCINCVHETTNSFKIFCFFCKTNHDVPPGGFKTNTSVEKLIKAMPTKLDQKTLLAKTILTEKLETFNKIVEEFSIKISDLEPNLDQHLAAVRSKIDLQFEETVLKIDKIRGEFFKTCGEYKDKCTANIESHMSDLTKIKDHATQIVQKYTACLKASELDDKLLDHATCEINSALKSISSINFDSIGFTDFKIFFEPNKAQPPPASIGRIFYTLERCLVYGVYKDKITVWDLKTGDVFKTIENKRLYSSWLPECYYEILGICLWKTKYLISGDSHGYLKIWDFDSGDVKSLRQNSPIQCLVAMDENTVVSGSQDGSLQFWNISISIDQCTVAECIATMKLSGGVGCLCKLTATRIVVEYHKNGISDTDIYDFKSNKIEFITGFKHTRLFNHVAILDDSNIVCSGPDIDKIWNFQSKSDVWRFPSPSDRDKSNNCCLVVISPNTIVISRDEIKVWIKTSTSCWVCDQRYNYSAKWLLNFGTRWLVGGNGKTILVWDLESLNKVREIFGPCSIATSNSFPANFSAKYFEQQLDLDLPISSLYMN